MLWIGTIMVFVALISSAVTMYHVSSLPADSWKYMQVENRWANWPKKPCYSKENIELLIKGPKYEHTKKTYIASIKSQFIWLTR